MTNEFLVNYRSLKTSLLSAQSQALTASVLNYCATKIFGCPNVFDHLYLGFLTSTLAPQTGKAFQAEIILGPFGTPAKRSCANVTAYLNDHPIPLRDGVASIRTTFPTPGQHTLRIRFRRERCRDGSVTEVSRDFTVNVLEQCNPND